jgi:hypothetical protein
VRDRTKEGQEVRVVSSVFDMSGDIQFLKVWTESGERRAESREQGAESREQRAESREQRAESCDESLSSSSTLTSLTSLICKVRSEFYQDFHGVLLVFDITSRAVTNISLTSL